MAIGSRGLLTQFAGCHRPHGHLVAIRLAHAHQVQEFALPLVDRVLRIDQLPDLAVAVVVPVDIGRAPGIGMLGNAAVIEPGRDPCGQKTALGEFAKMPLVFRRPIVHLHDADAVALVVVADPGLVFGLVVE